MVASVLLPWTLALSCSTLARAAPAAFEWQKPESLSSVGRLPLDESDSVLLLPLGVSDGALPRSPLADCSLPPPSVATVAILPLLLFVCAYGLWSRRRGRLAEAAAACPSSAELASLHAALVTPFDPASDRSHEAMLRAVWVALAGDAKFERASPRWKEMGFQGVDPATDARGGGALAMACVSHFAATHARALGAMLDAVREASAEENARYYPVLAVGVVVCTRLCDALGLSHGMRGAISRAELEALRRARPKHADASGALAKLLHEPKLDERDTSTCTPMLRRTLSDAGEKVRSYLCGRPRLPANFFNLFALVLVDFHSRFSSERKTYMQSKQLIDEAIERLMLRAADAASFDALRAAYFADPRIARALEEMQQ